MPRRTRIDAPGAVHQIMAWGVERRKIFLDDPNRDSFVRRLGELVNETQTLCNGWASIPNHFHLLLKTGRVPVATFMRRLLTGFAIGFNRCHRRSGHVFQNRYESISAILSIMCWPVHRRLWIKNMHRQLKGSDFHTSISPQDLAGPCKERTIVKARALVCY